MKITIDTNTEEGKEILKYLINNQWSDLIDIKDKIEKLTEIPTYRKHAYGQSFITTRISNSLSRGGIKYIEQLIDLSNNIPVKTKRYIYNESSSKWKYIYEEYLSLNDLKILTGMGEGGIKYIQDYIDNYKTHE